MNLTQRIEEILTQGADLSDMPGLSEMFSALNEKRTKQLTRLFEEHSKELVRGARIDENESIEIVLEAVIEQDGHCDLHEGYVPQCHGCKKKNWEKHFANLYIKSIRERLRELSKEDNAN